MSRRSSWIPFTPSSTLPKRTQVAYELLVNSPEVFTTGFLKNIKVPKPSSWEDLCSSNEIEVVKIACPLYTNQKDFQAFANFVFSYEKEEVRTKRIERLWKIIQSLQTK